MSDLLALVKFNSEKALVLRDSLQLTYRKYGDLLIGMDESGTFMNLLYYEAPNSGFKAFGGREFDITLENGEVIHCNGQYWNGGRREAEKVLNEEIISVTVNDVESLKKCYVFRGMFAKKSKVEKLIEEYAGELFAYRDYELNLGPRRG
ncbi:hypothetical protein [Paenibacillus ehimensis]|uniref:Uncharacterized protein n=1 Tax=Paenibacillus ehimensis TaxID=79264 RepID=A0ABT8VMH2_9BACL|nr:hypothetical protein [Paenibacillus ehimensis]MDO3682177.1 hypothetical protein [Paenibacillus ehimensis]